MRVPLNFPCDTCGKADYFFVDLNDTSFVTKCTCGAENAGILDLNVTVGYKLFLRARFELVEKKDYSLSIVLSATAFECELSRLHYKWNQLAALDKGECIADSDLEEMLRKYRSIDLKIEAVARLMDPLGLTSFVMESQELAETVRKGFPSLHIDQLAKDFQKTLFRPRNRILHLADSSFREPDAKRCISISALALRIFEAMDVTKSNVG